jgi:hypothetical protein
MPHCSSNVSPHVVVREPSDPKSCDTVLPLYHEPVVRWHAGVFYSWGVVFHPPPPPLSIMWECLCFPSIHLGRGVVKHIHELGAEPAVTRHAVRCALSTPDIRSYKANMISQASMEFLLPAPPYHYSDGMYIRHPLRPHDMLTSAALTLYG